MTLLSDRNCHHIRINFSALCHQSITVKNKLRWLASLSRKWCMPLQNWLIAQTSVSIHLMQHFMSFLQCLAWVNTKLYRLMLFFNLHFQTDDMTAVCSTARTYNDVTSRCFNIQTSFCTLIVRFYTTVCVCFCVWPSGVAVCVYKVQTVVLDQPLYIVKSNDLKFRTIYKNLTYP